MIMKKLIATLIVVIFALEGYAQTANFFQMFGDNLILQRNTSAKIWGDGDPNTTVTITTSWDNAKYNTTTDANGDWSVFVKTPEGSYTKYEINLKAPKTDTTIKNVVIGEVWLAVGQSNMVRPVRSATSGSEDLAANQDEWLRLWKNRDRHPNAKDPSRGTTSSFNIHTEPQKTLFVDGGGWVDSTDRSASNFSAVAWYFGRQLRDRLDMPVGVIQSAVGATNADAWLPPQVAAQFPWMDVGAPFDGNRDQLKPSVCYNGLIHPLVGFTIKGMIWYQGESGGSPDVMHQYEPAFHAIINSYRELWGIGDFPFYFVNIVPYKKSDDNKIAIFANMQRETHYKIKNTGLAATLDHPCCDNIHPKDKKYIGERLSYWALNKDYGLSDVVPSGPLAREAAAKGNKIKVYFDYAETGLVDSSGTGFKHFEVAGADEVFHAAEVVISPDNSLILSSSAVSDPKFARYGYVPCPEIEATLFNGAGLPAPQFLVEASN